MKRILYLLSGDSENLSLCRTYQILLDRGYSVDCYAPRTDIVSLYPFARERGDFLYLTEINQEIIDGYDAVICGRNGFDIPNPEILIRYRGIIIADDTCFYEGHSVYGDYICTCGELNAQNIPEYLRDRVFITGCIKADYDSDEISEYWKLAGDDIEERVLYIESGHFPFGKRGRSELASAFCRMVREHPQSFFIVKPRFLEGEVKYAKHRNADHLYRYIWEAFQGVLPENLVLLDTHEDMSLLVNGADVCIHTYCSAHIEVVLAKKKLLNICDVPSEEVADFRKERFRQVTRMIDQAGCGISLCELSEGLSCAHRASESYEKKVNFGEKGAAARFVETTERLMAESAGWEDVSKVRERRFLAYARKKMEYFENRLDDYSLCDAITLDVTDIWRNPVLSFEEKLQRLEEYIDGFIMTLMERKKEPYQRDWIQRSFCLRFLADRLPMPVAERLGDDYLAKEGEYIAADFYYMAFKSFFGRDYPSASYYLKVYIKETADLAYETTDAENAEVVLRARDLLCEVERLC